MAQTRVTFIGKGSIIIRSASDYESIAKHLHEQGYLATTRVLEGGGEMRVCLMRSAVAALYPEEDWDDNM